MELTVKDRISEFIKFKNISVRKFERMCGLSNGYINGIDQTIMPDKMSKISLIFPDLSTGWVLSGEGKMLKVIDDDFNGNTELFFIPLLPVSAQGGSLNDFIVSVKDADCEKIVSPIKGADFAITVSGESMAPEYPSGSKILIKKINDRSFIEWGRCYVLDTCNGTVVKKLMAPEEEDEEFGLDYITCVSVNPNPIYKPFRVPKKDIYGIYRVLLSLTEK
jgi:hypothetical protein